MLRIYPTTEEFSVRFSHAACLLPCHQTVLSGAYYRSSSDFSSSSSLFVQSPSPQAIESGYSTGTSTNSDSTNSDSDRDSHDSSTDHDLHQHTDSVHDDQSEASSLVTTTKNNKNNNNNNKNNNNNNALFLSCSPESFSSVTGGGQAWGSPSRRSPMRRALDRIHRDTGGDGDGDGQRRQRQRQRQRQRKRKRQRKHPQ